jgi:hypothetical protein
MDFISKLSLIAWIVEMVVMAAVNIFLVLRYRHAINGRIFARQVALFMVINAIFLMVFLTTTMKPAFEQLVCVTIQLIIMTVFVTLIGYLLGKRTERVRCKEREDTEDVT